MVPGTSKGLTADAVTATIRARDGWLTCPLCKQNKKLLRVHADTEARNLEVFCRYCRRAVILDITQGQSSRSQSR